MMNRLKLTVNETKTRLCPPVPDETVSTSLGFTRSAAVTRRRRERGFHRHAAPSQTKWSLGCAGRSAKNEQAGQSGPKDVKEQVAVINRKLIGWSNFFRPWTGEQKPTGAVDYQRRPSASVNGLCKKAPGTRGLGLSRFLGSEYLYLELGSSCPTSLDKA